MISIRPFFLIVLVTICFSSCAPNGKVRSVPGCKCEMYVPDGLTEVKGFTGFQHPADGVAIKVTQQPNAYSGLSQAIDAKVLKASGMNLIRKEEVEGSNQATYFYMTQESGGITYLQHMVLMGDNDKTYIFTAILPQKLADEWNDQLKKAVLSASCKDLVRLANTTQEKVPQ